MSLNPVQFGKDIVDQFGRYLLTTFPLADDGLAQQVREKLVHGLGGDGLLYRGPFVMVNRPFLPGPSLDSLVQSGALHTAMQSIIQYDSLHAHQGEALAAVQAGHNLLLSTGTGSGKTEAFLLPILDHCLRLRDSGAPEGVTAVLVYPMNALVNDQLERLRLMLAGTGITFGRYTGETPRAADASVQFAGRAPYTESQRKAYREGANFGTDQLPLPWEESFTQDDIRARKPRLLLTNYSQLEYLLLRHRDLDLFRDAPLRFMVFDEVHTYTGALGSEVACLIRRLRDVARKSSREVRMLGTSATVSDPEHDATESARRFAHRLFGVPTESIAVVREQYEPLAAPSGRVPPLPVDLDSILTDVLESARTLTGIDSAASRLIGRPGSALELLQGSPCIAELAAQFDSPKSWVDVLPAWRALGGGRDAADDDTLVAEMLAYLTLGALVTDDDEPLLRPKLHYFVQGLQGLGIIFSPDAPPRLRFNQEDDALPMLVCRSCGQHYARLLVQQWRQTPDGRHGYRTARIPGIYGEPEADETWLYLTNGFHTQEDDENGDGGGDTAQWEKLFVCTSCHTIHQVNGPCENPRCGAPGPMVELLAYAPTTGGIPKKCGACAGPNATGLISPTRSAAVADVTILSQAMLTMMPERDLRKLLIFCDNRQEAAFQAGWMEARSRRFRLRHLAYQLARDNGEPEAWQTFADRLAVQAVNSEVFDRVDFNQKDQLTRASWYLIEEFTSRLQRRGTLEQLGLMEIAYGGPLTAHDDQSPFFDEWAAKLRTTPSAVRDLLRMLLDMARRRGMLSDPLLARNWNDRDREVRNGLVRIPDFFRAEALAFSTQKNTYVRGWTSRNGRSTYEVALAQSASAPPPSRSAFLEAAWHWLIEHDYLVQVTLSQARYGLTEHDYLVQVTLSQARYGKLETVNVPATIYHVNHNRVGVTIASTRWVCSHCGRTQFVATPSGSCPEYNCKGTLSEQPLDDDHYDVYQYTRLSEFVPLLPREHTAQVPSETRQSTERDFKGDGRRVNTIVATPTLEMGVDIGRLEMVMMRNAPPTPANYAQRAGRAGRRHRIGIVTTYAGVSQHDRYFYTQPEEMIAGSVRVPAFSMRNEPLIRKHVHSATLTALREWTETAAERDVLERTFPQFIKNYVFVAQGENNNRLKLLTNPPDFRDFKDLIQDYRDRILQRLETLFSSDWPEQDSEAVAPAVLERCLDEMADQLARQVRLLHSIIRSYTRELDQMPSAAEMIEEDKKLRSRLENAISRYKSERIENYALSWLASEGFFPGYALSRGSVSATCLNTQLEVSRPSAVALRELTPANSVYADRRVYRVVRLNIGKLRTEHPDANADILRETLHVETTAEGVLRLLDPQSAPEGSPNIERKDSYVLADVELDDQEKIGDSRETRVRVAFQMLGALLNRHKGGEYGRVGQYSYKFLRSEQVRLVNLGLLSDPKGFPFCPVCGEARSPKSSQEDIDKFAETHRKKCNVNSIRWTALHVDTESDVLTIGPFGSAADAVNAMEGLLIGARATLDMGDNELEGFTYPEDNNLHWLALYDTLPGGSGFIDQMLLSWDVLCANGVAALSHCDCGASCYKCMQHFRNQQHHTVLDRFAAMELLDAVGVNPDKEHTIPPTATDAPASDPTNTESWAEDRFLAVLSERGFPIPSATQYTVELKNGDITIADFAWPDRRVLVFVDGMSSRLHGNSDQAERDRRKRRKARMEGYFVVEMTANDLSDESALSLKLEEIGDYLEG